MDVIAILQSSSPLVADLVSDISSERFMWLGPEAAGRPFFDFCYWIQR
jgi:hypothetical protein